MTIECSRSVHSIVLRMAWVNSNVFTSAISIKKAACSVKKYAERVFRPSDRRLRSAVNGSGQLCRQRFTVRQLWHFRGKNQILFAAMTCPKSFSNRPPSVLTGCRVIIFLKETDIASDVGVADLLADRLDRVGSVGQQREGTFRAVAV